MAVVKFVNSGSPMNNIFDYVTRREATESKLISGVNCSPESALDEFRFVKKRFHKEDGRSYYHIVQSFSPRIEICRILSGISSACCNPYQYKSHS